MSPVNGQPLPRGKPFTSETAREARQKRTEKDNERQSIAAAFRKNMNQVFKDEKGNEMTGAEIIAQSIIKGANNGNAKMVEIALSLMGEKPSDTVIAQLRGGNVVIEIDEDTDE